MVVRLEGKVNGHDVIFSRREGDTWEGVFPFQEKCEVIIELTAYDEAGNFCYKTCYLLAFDPNSLYIKLVPAEYWLKPILEEAILMCVWPVDYQLRPIAEDIYLKYRDCGEELVRSD